MRGQMFERFKKIHCPPPSFSPRPSNTGEKNYAPANPRVRARGYRGDEFKKKIKTNFYTYIYILGLIEKNRAKFRGVVILFFLSFIFLTMREKYRRASILDPHQEKERSLEGSVGVVTGCHAGSLEGQRHPEELSQLVGHLPTSYGGGLLAVVFAIHL